MKLGGPLKVKCLYITVALGPFESRIVYLHTAAALGSPFEGRILNYDVVRKTLYEGVINVSPKVRNIYARNTMRGAPKMGGPI